VQWVLESTVQWVLEGTESTVQWVLENTVLRKRRIILKLIVKKYVGRCRVG